MLIEQDMKESLKKEASANKVRRKTLFMVYYLYSLLFYLITKMIFEGKKFEDDQ
jgi:hypothetical protein